MEGSLGLRKGAWSREEDELLKACIQQHGEGKWHLFPQRAGLRRCRKSCRLRWLNYLKPDIKRGEFADDEVDLLMRCHRLLGNRWSLIAGRLPGRTSNDVKNYWNIHMRKKGLSHHREDTNKIKPEATIKVPHKVIKPQPRSFSRNSAWLRGKPEEAVAVNIAEPCHQALPQVQQQSDKNNLIVDWWESLLDVDDKVADEEGNSLSSSLLGEQEAGKLLMDEELVGMMPKPSSNFLMESDSCWIDFPLDTDLWEF